jgi:AraC-like DNA-binding protein
MPNISKYYTPLTANPFVMNDTYMEIAPCDELKPYIRCFWGTKKPIQNQNNKVIRQEGIVIPDTCMDILFDIDFTDNTIRCHFSGINDSSFWTSNAPNTHMVSSFAIRFYAWSVIFFSSESMKKVKNSFTDTNEYFTGIKDELEKVLFEITDIYDRKRIAEKFLLEKLNRNKMNPYVLNSVSQTIKHHGNVRGDDLTTYSCVGRRQLERLYQEYVGISPYKLADLIRYQYLWNDILTDKNFDVFTAVLKYGYTDQAHLLHNFKKYHTMNPMQAKGFALLRK